MQINNYRVAFALHWRFGLFPSAALSILIFLFIGARANAGVDLQSYLIADNFNQRFIASQSVEKGLIADSNFALTLFINALKSEISNPFSNEGSPYSPFHTMTESLKKSYASAIEKLATQKLEVLRGHLAGTQSELRDRLLIILGRLRDQSVKDSVASILLNNSDVYLRWEAIRALRSYKDTADIPIFWNYINDGDSLIEVQSPESKYEPDIVYPVRVEAACALIEFGYKFKRTGKYYENYELIEE
jgi:hypothetical protein